MGSGIRRVSGEPLRRWLWAIVALAIVLRLGAALYLGDDVAPEPGIFDQVSYDALARRVLAGDGFSFGREWWPATAAGAPTAHWSFLYTLYLAAVYALFGPHPLVARIFQAVAAGVLMPWLTYRLGRRAFGPAAGLAAAAIAAVYVYFFFYGASLMTETFYMVGILWTLDLAGRIKRSGNGEPGKGGTGNPREATGDRCRALGRWLLLGLAMGLTVLLRQTFLPIVALVGLWLWWAAPGKRAEVVRGFGLSLVVVALLVAPWTIRNYRAFGQFVLLNTNAGYAFYWANHPVHGTNFMALLPPEISYQSLIPQEWMGLNEAALGKALMRRGIQFVVDDPGRYVLLSLSRLKDQFLFWPSSRSGLLSNVSRVGSFGLFLPFMLWGAWLAIRQRAGIGDGAHATHPASRLANLAAWLRTEPALWLAFFLLYSAMHLASWAAVRYRLPTDAVMILFAGLAVARLGKTIWRAAGPRALRHLFHLKGKRAQ